MTSSDLASWVQAVGSITAVLGAGWIATQDARASRRREEVLRQDALAREEKALLAARSAALNLALLAAAQIRELHNLMRDETRRTRVSRVSPSHNLLDTERMLLAFPIQSLADAEAMVAFSYFPGFLAGAAEIYANLEKKVRGAPPEAHKAIFAEFAKHMAPLEGALERRLEDLRRALKLPDAPAD